tara:strand:- start:3216 stop:3662 length:447 start_codon:yes stop_codon:yes gene_type:complete
VLTAIRDFFNSKMARASEPSEDRSVQEIQLATAALLIELAKADRAVDDKEWRIIVDTLERTFHLPTETLQELVSLAEEELQEATDLFQFTQLVNQHYSYKDKLQLLKAMWQVAFADGQIDKYEDHLIRKVAGLIHVPHSDFIKTKHSV